MINQLKLQGFGWDHLCDRSKTNYILTWCKRSGIDGGRWMAYTHIIYKDHITFHDHFVATHEYRGLNLTHRYGI